MLLLLLSQLPFSGWIVPSKDMSGSLLSVSQIMPSFAAERITEVSVIWGPENIW
jgi:hypothetical protein